MDSIDKCLWNEVVKHLDEVSLFVLRMSSKSLYCPIKIEKSKLLSLAAKQGYLEVIKYLLELGYPLKKRVSFSAACYGHLDILNWYPKKLDDRLVFYAAKGGQIEVYNCLRGKRLDHEQKYLRSTECGQFEFLKYIMTEKFNDNYLLISLAVHHGHVEILEWLLQKGIRFRYNGYYLDIRRNHIQILDILHTNGIDMTKYYCAGDTGLEVLKYEISLGCMLAQTTMEGAASAGDIQVLKYCTKKGLVLSRTVFSNACESGNIECVKWLVNNGCTISKDAIIIATKNGNLDLVILLISYGVNTDNIALNAATEGHLHILRWFKDNGYNVLKESVFIGALAKGYIHILDWLGYKYMGNDDLFLHAIISDKVETIRWLKAQDYESRVTNYISYAVSNKCYNVLLFLLHKGKILNESNIEAIVENKPSIIKAVIKSGCKLPANVCDIAAGCCSPKVIEMLVNLGYKLSIRGIHNAIVCNRHVEKWIATNYELDDKSVELITNWSSNDIKIMQILSDRGYKIQ